ncbi:hypothetical protein [uncultured Roseovarius sp.]|uniref:hypothetical protein n=1 Tax=uncultured Roseovarius sp. TaxID=293344 RepID=UPI002629F43D|nr:hypothetical protein [uncultured Roseovarius sp.]
MSPKTQAVAQMRAGISAHVAERRSISPVKSAVMQRVRQDKEGWFTDNGTGPYESEFDAKYQEYAETYPGQAQIIERWEKFTPANIEVKEIGSYEDLGEKHGKTFGGGNNGMWVRDKTDNQEYFIKGYARENMPKPESEPYPKDMKSQDEAPLIEPKEGLDEDSPVKVPQKSGEPSAAKKDKPARTGEKKPAKKQDPTAKEPAEKPAEEEKDPVSLQAEERFKERLKQAMKNKKSIYEYMAIEAYAKAGLEPPFRSRLYQDEKGRVFVANDWTNNVGSVLPNERRKGSGKKKESQFDRWDRAKLFIQGSEAFKNGLAMDLVFGMHDMLNADNWKFVGTEEEGDVKPFDFGGPFDVRATSLQVDKEGRQDKEGWAIAENSNVLGKWLNEATLSMLNFAEGKGASQKEADQRRKKSVYANVSEDILKNSAMFVKDRWETIIGFVETELGKKGVHPEDVEAVVKVLKVRAKTMQLLASNEMPSGQYIAWNPDTSLAEKFPGLSADPKARRARLQEDKTTEPLVATVPRERVEGGGLLHTGLVETERKYGKICVRVYQTAFAPLNDKTVDSKFKDVYQDPLTNQIQVSTNQKKSGEVASTCFGVGRPLRALKWAEQYLTQHGVNADAQPVVRSFLVPYETYLKLLDKTIQHGSKKEPAEDFIQNIDSHSAPDQLEMRASHLAELKKSALAGSLDTYVMSAPQEFKSTDRISHGNTKPMRALYDRLGVPVFADTMSDEYHPWVTHDKHVDQSSGSGKRRKLRSLSDIMSRLDELTLSRKDEAPEAEEIEGNEEIEAAAKLKLFLIKHVGENSRYLGAVQREYSHLKNVRANEAPPGIALDPSPDMTDGDRETILHSEIVRFYMNDIVGSALTQLEILRQYGSWTKAVNKEKKPDCTEGPEVYSYSSFDMSQDFEGHRAQHFKPMIPFRSLRWEMASTYHLEKYDSRLRETRSKRVLDKMRETGLLKGDPGPADQLLVNLIDSDNPELLGLSDDDMMDLLISTGIYGKAWMSAAAGDEDVAFSTSRRSEGSAEYLAEDLEGIATSRSNREDKSKNLVKREINAELGVIPALEKFTDKGLRFSPTHAPRGKQRTDISAYATLARELAKRTEDMSEEGKQDLANSALKDALVRIRSNLRDKTDESVWKMEFALWKATTQEMTKGPGALSDARALLGEALKDVSDPTELDNKISQVEKDLDKNNDLAAFFDTFK